MKDYLPKAAVKTFNREPQAWAGGMSHLPLLPLWVIGISASPSSLGRSSLSHVMPLLILWLQVQSWVHTFYWPLQAHSKLLKPAWTTLNGFACPLASCWVWPIRTPPFRRLEGGELGQTMHFWPSSCNVTSHRLCPLTSGHCSFPDVQQYMTVSFWVLVITHSFQLGIGKNAASTSRGLLHSPLGYCGFSHPYLQK